MMKKVLVVTNSNAGRKKAVKHKKKLVKFLLRHAETFKTVDLDELKTTDVQAFDTILVMGGDGTVNKVLPCLVNTYKTLGIIPCGTANLLAAKLGITGNLKKNLKILEKGKTKNIDTLNINDNLCVLRCGFGFDSDIICKTPQSLKNKFGYFAYFVAGIIFALRLKKKEYILRIDGEEKTYQASCIIIANAANMYRNFIAVGKDSSPNDGLMDIFILKTTNPVALYFELLKMGFNIYKNNSAADYTKAKSVQILNKWTVCHIDGEKKNLQNDINMSINPHSVRVICR